MFIAKSYCYKIKDGYESGIILCMVFVFTRLPSIYRSPINLLMYLNQFSMYFSTKFYRDDNNYSFGILYTTLLSQKIDLIL